MKNKIQAGQKRFRISGAFFVQEVKSSLLFVCYEAVIYDKIRKESGDRNTKVKSSEEVGVKYMQAYTNFAGVYDTFMDNVPYGEWADRLEEILKEYGVNNGLMLDLGCGTGSMTECFAERGYDMIGVDNAEDMLEIAVGKREKSGYDILYLLQDMREFELYGTVRAVISVCDCVNYVAEPEELLEVFRLVNNYLDPAGIFLFDFNTRFKYERVLGNRTFAESRDECSFIWDNYYYEDEKMNEYELTLFIREEGTRKLFRKYQETHYQRGYTLEEIKALIERSGMEYLRAYDAYSKHPANAQSERILVAARERGKGLQFVIEREQV